MLHSQAVVLCAAIGAVLGHGWLAQPPGRSSAWRVGFSTPKNYDDNGLNCGGFAVQHGVYGGRCGLCGDSYGGPRANEPGPDNMYADGTIVANYTQGQSIAIKVQITASHMGYHEFRLFRNDAPQRGRDASVAVRIDAPNALLASADGRTRFDEKDPNIVLKLPTDAACDACVLQWRWRTGNSWGCDDNGCGLGHGNQEEFYGCSDVRIIAGSAAADSVSSQSQTTAGTTTRPDAAASRPASAASQRASIAPSAAGRTTTADQKQTKSYTQAATRVAETTTIAVASAPTSQGSVPAAGAPVTTLAGLSAWACEARKPYSGDVQKWCNVNCNRVPRFCPPTHCVCAST